MGVQGLLQYILNNPSTREKVKLRQFGAAHLKKTGKQPEILCDLVCVLKWLLSSLDYAFIERETEPPYCLLYCGVLKDYSERILSFVRILQSLGLSVVFCVEGCPGTREEFGVLYETYYAQSHLKQQEAVNILQICASNQDMTQLQWTLKESVLNHIIFTLESADNVRLLYCSGQVLPRAISYMQSNKHVCGILSTNTSYAVASGCGLVLLDFLSLNIEHSTPSLPPLETGQDLSCEIVWSTWLASSLDLTEHQLADMAIVCGNEYTQYLNTKLQLVYALGISDAGIVEVAEWLRSQNVHLSAVSEMAKFMDSNPSYQKAIKISYRTYRNIKEPQSPDVQEKYPVLQAVISAGGVLSPQMVSVVAGEVYWRPALTEPEVLNCPRFCDITILIRKFIYALVGVSKVTEFGYITSSSSLTQIPIDVVRSATVDLPALLSLPTNQRLSILYRFVTSPQVLESPEDLECLVCAAKVEGEAIKDAAEGGTPNSSRILLFSAMVFMRTANRRLSPSPNIFVSELEAILVAVLCSVAGFPLLSLNHVPPAKGVTLASWFSHLLDQAYWLASCLGLSRDLPAPGVLFSAHQYVLFHLASSLCEDFEQSSSPHIVPNLQQICAFYQEIWELAPVLTLRAKLLEECIPSVSTVLQVFGSAVEAVTASQTLRDLAKKLERNTLSSLQQPSTTTESEVGCFHLDLEDCILSGVDSPHSLGREELSSTQECKATEEDHFFSSQSLGASCEIGLESCDDDESDVFDEGSCDHEGVSALGGELMSEGCLVADGDTLPTSLLLDSSVESIVMSDEGRLVMTEAIVPADLLPNVSEETVTSEETVLAEETIVAPDEVVVEKGALKPQHSGASRGNSHKPSWKKKKPSSKAPKPDLPIMKHRSQILDLIRGNTVICIEGETGCGKSTMVPQFILDESLSQQQEGENTCRILVTQPRRVAAIKLAERVSAERGERLGNTVGYCVGGDHHRAASTRLTYCTIGYLLQALVHHPQSVQWYSHIILDEIHERSTDADFALLVVRKLVSESGGAKIVIMSATMQGTLLVNYFEERFHYSVVSAPYFVGSKYYPVQSYFIDQLDSLVHNSKLHWHKKQGKARDSLRTLIANMPKENLKESMSAIPKVKDFSMDVCTQVIVSQSRLGESILVFLPGIATITKYYDRLSQYLEEQGIAKYFRLFILHSQVPLEEQKDAFVDPPPDTVHVILATNIAESSITLPKLRMVVNFGIYHQLQYDKKKRICCLMKKWCSHSSCTQRAGRAGRVFDGVCIHLFTSQFYESILPQYDQPEILNASLAKLVLQAKVIGEKLGVPSPSELLCSAIEQPSLEQMEVALRDLADLGAIASSGGGTVNEEADITLLGYFSLSLPVDLSLCRLVLFGVFFGIPLEGITIAASLSLYQDVFSQPSRMILPDDNTYLQKLKRSTEARVYFDGGQYSDAVVVCNMFREWIEFRNTHLCGGTTTTKSKHSLTRLFCTGSAVRWERLLQLESSVASIAAKVNAYIPSNHKMHAELLQLVSLADHGSGGFHLPAKVGGKSKKGLQFTRVEVHFCEEVLTIKALVTAAFSNQILIGCSEVNSPNVAQKKRARRFLNVMKSYHMDPTETVVMHHLKNPQPGSLHRLMMSILPHRLVNVHMDIADAYISLMPKFGTSPKTALMVQQALARGENLVSTDSENSRWNPFMMEESVATVKLSPDMVYTWQFCERKADWTISGMEDIFTRPQHPLLACWSRLNSDGAFAAACNWRYPSSLLLTAEERTCIGVAATLKGIDNINKVMARDLTILPNSHGSATALLLVLAFQPLQTSINLLVKDDVIVGMRVDNQSIPFMDSQFLTRDDLVRVNALRKSMSDVLCSFCEDEALFPMDKIVPIHSLLDCVLRRSPNNLVSRPEGASAEKPHRVNSIMQWSLVEYGESKGMNEADTFFEEFEYPAADSFCYYPQMSCNFLKGFEVADIPEHQLRVGHLFRTAETHASSVVFSLGRGGRLRQRVDFKLSPLAKSFVPSCGASVHTQQLPVHVSDQEKLTTESPLHAASTLRTVGDPPDSTVDPSDSAVDPSHSAVDQQASSNPRPQPNSVTSREIPLAASSAAAAPPAMQLESAKRCVDLALYQQRPALLTDPKVSYDASHVPQFFPSYPGFGPILSPFHGHFNQAIASEGVARKEEKGKVNWEQVLHVFAANYYQVMMRLREGQCVPPPVLPAIPLPLATPPGIVQGKVEERLVTPPPGLVQGRLEELLVTPPPGFVQERMEELATPPGLVQGRMEERLVTPPPGFVQRKMGEGLATPPGLVQGKIEEHMVSPPPGFVQGRMEEGLATHPGMEERLTSHPGIVQGRMEEDLVTPPLGFVQEGMDEVPLPFKPRELQPEQVRAMLPKYQLRSCDMEISAASDFIPLRTSSGQNLHYSVVGGGRLEELICVPLEPEAPGVRVGESLRDLARALCDKVITTAQLEVVVAKEVKTAQCKVNDGEGGVADVDVTTEVMKATEEVATAHREGSDGEGGVAVKEVITEMRVAQDVVTADGEGGVAAEEVITEVRVTEKVATAHCKGSLVAEEVAMAQGSVIAECDTELQSEQPPLGGGLTKKLLELLPGYVPSTHDHSVETNSPLQRGSPADFDFPTSQGLEQQSRGSLPRYGYVPSTHDHSMSAPRPLQRVDPDFPTLSQGLEQQSRDSLPQYGYVPPAGYVPSTHDHSVSAPRPLQRGNPDFPTSMQGWEQQSRDSGLPRYSVPQQSQPYNWPHPDVGVSPVGAGPHIASSTSVPHLPFNTHQSSSRLSPFVPPFPPIRITSSPSEQLFPINTHSSPRKPQRPPLLNEPPMLPRYPGATYSPPSAYSQARPQCHPRGPMANQQRHGKKKPTMSGKEKKLFELSAHCTGQYRVRYQHPPWVSKLVCGPNKVDPACVYRNPGQPQAGPSSSVNPCNGGPDEPHHVINTDYIPPAGSIWNDLVVPPQSGRVTPQTAGRGRSHWSPHNAAGIDDGLVANFFCNYLKVTGGWCPLETMCGPVYKYFLNTCSINFSQGEVLSAKFFLAFADRFLVAFQSGSPIVILTETGAWSKLGTRGAMNFAPDVGMGSTESVSRESRSRTRGSTESTSREWRSKVSKTMGSVELVRARGSMKSKHMESASVPVLSAEDPIPGVSVISKPNADARRETAQVTDAAPVAVMYEWEMTEACVIPGTDTAAAQQTNVEGDLSSVSLTESTPGPLIDVGSGKNDALGAAGDQHQENDTQERYSTKHTIVMNVEDISPTREESGIVTEKATLEPVMISAAPEVDPRGPREMLVCVESPVNLPLGGTSAEGAAPDLQVPKETLVCTQTPGTSASTSVLSDLRSALSRYGFPDEDIMLALDSINRMKQQRSVSTPTLGEGQVCTGPPTVSTPALGEGQVCTGPPTVSTPALGEGQVCTGPPTAPPTLGEGQVCTAPPTAPEAPCEQSSVHAGFSDCDSLVLANGKDPTFSDTVICETSGNLPSPATAWSELSGSPAPANSTRLDVVAGTSLLTQHTLEVYSAEDKTVSFPPSDNSQPCSLAVSDTDLGGLSSLDGNKVLTSQPDPVPPVQLSKTIPQSEAVESLNSVRPNAISTLKSLRATDASDHQQSGHPFRPSSAPCSSRGGGGGDTPDDTLRCSSECGDVDTPQALPTKTSRRVPDQLFYSPPSVRGIAPAKPDAAVTAASSGSSSRPPKASGSSKLAGSKAPDLSKPVKPAGSKAVKPVALTPDLSKPVKPAGSKAVKPVALTPGLSKPVKPAGSKAVKPVALAPDSSKPVKSAGSKAVKPVSLAPDSSIPVKPAAPKQVKPAQDFSKPTKLASKQVRAVVSVRDIYQPVKPVKPAASKQSKHVVSAPDNSEPAASKLVKPVTSGAPKPAVSVANKASDISKHDVASTVCHVAGKPSLEATKQPESHSQLESAQVSSSSEKNPKPIPAIPILPDKTSNLIAKEVTRVLQDNNRMCFLSTILEDAKVARVLEWSNVRKLDDDFFDSRPEFETRPDQFGGEEGSEDMYVVLNAGGSVLLMGSGGSRDQKHSPNERDPCSGQPGFRGQAGQCGSPGEEKQDGSPKVGHTLTEVSHHHHHHSREGDRWPKEQRSWSPEGNFHPHTRKRWLPRRKAESTEDVLGTEVERKEEGIVKEKDTVIHSAASKKKKKKKSRESERRGGGEDWGRQDNSGRGSRGYVEGTGRDRWRRGNDSWRHKGDHWEKDEGRYGRKGGHYQERRGYYGKGSWSRHNRYSYGDGLPFYSERPHSGDEGVEGPKGATSADRGAVATTKEAMEGAVGITKRAVEPEGTQTLDWPA